MRTEDSNVADAARALTYGRPASLAEALEHRARGADVLAGATDIYPALVPGIDGTRAPRRPGAVLDLLGIGPLRGIEQREREIRLGATTTWTEIAEAHLPPPLRCLQLAAREVGGRQIQNRGTIGGNLVNASPAADGVPPLLALDAEVELQSVRGTRRLPVGAFVAGPRTTLLAPDELLTAVILPVMQRRVCATFLKLGARRYLVISIVMVAAVVETERGRVAAARIAVGAASPVARRLQRLEAELVGRPLDARLGDTVDAGHLTVLAPIDDVRASADYRRHAALTLVRRALAEIGNAAP